MADSMEKRDTLVYQLKDGNRVVYYAITDHPDWLSIRRDNAGKKFSRVEMNGGPMAREAAADFHKKRIRTYQRTHGGLAPRYNQVEIDQER